MAFSDYLKILKTLVTLADDVQRYNAEVKEIRKELRDLTIVVTKLGQAVAYSEERAEGERERIRLELENALLKFERRLPPAKEGEEDK
jgi:chromosome condensin MukBEF ATPase and DNA-binding subunit MukB